MSKSFDNELPCCHYTKYDLLIAKCSLWSNTRVVVYRRSVPLESLDRTCSRKILCWLVWSINDASYGSAKDEKVRGEKQSLKSWIISTINYHYVVYTHKPPFPKSGLRTLKTILTSMTCFDQSSFNWSVK